MTGGVAIVSLHTQRGGFVRPLAELSLTRDVLFVCLSTSIPRSTVFVESASACCKNLAANPLNRSWRKLQAWIPFAWLSCKQLLVLLYRLNFLWARTKSKSW